MNIFKYTLIYLFLISSIFANTIIGQKAPSFAVDSWVQTPIKNLDIQHFKGKVLYIYGFQKWCPYCHIHGFPTLNELTKHYKNEKKVSFVAIQTVFEGYEENNINGAKEVIEKYKLTIPVGHSGINEIRSQFMYNYKTRGTPWTIIVDKEGIVKYSDFHIEVDEAIELMDRLKK